MTYFQDLEIRLCNWGRAFHDSHVYGHCASAEHRYRAPREENGINSRENHMPVDMLDAELVEQAVCGMPRWQERLFLKALYVKRNRDEAARRLGCKVRDLAESKYPILAKLGTALHLIDLAHERIPDGVIRGVARHNMLRIYSAEQYLTPPSRCVWSQHGSFGDPEGKLNPA